MYHVLAPFPELLCLAANFEHQPSLSTFTSQVSEINQSLTFFILYFKNKNKNKTQSLAM